jgi:RimJ/RimL family protein N-acetyltransferase
MEPLSLSDDIESIAELYVNSGSLRFTVPFSHDRTVDLVADAIRGEHAGISYRNFWTLRAPDGDIESVLCVCDLSKIDLKAATKEFVKNMDNHNESAIFSSAYKCFIESVVPKNFYGRDLCITICESTEKYRGQGFPRTLLSQYCDMARAGGLCNTLFSDIPVGNKQTIKDFLSIGFRKERLIDSSAHVEPAIRVTIDLSQI